MSVDWEVRDCEDALVVVGSLVLYGADDVPGVVECISDPDGDVDDEGRPKEITPKVTVRFPAQGDTERADTYFDTPITWADYPDGPALRTYRVDDLTVSA